MTRKIKQYKPIKFGDGPDPDTVEGHRNKKIEAAETLAFFRAFRQAVLKGFSGMVRPSPASVLLWPTTKYPFANWICAQVSTRISASQTPEFKASVGAR